MKPRPDDPLPSTIFIRKAGPEGRPEKFVPAPAPKPEARSLRDLTPEQRKSGLAAWLGWLFDGLDMHLYGLVAAPFVAYLLHKEGLISDPSDVANDLVKKHSGWIQGSFLIGWALGGAFFGESMFHRVLIFGNETFLREKCRNNLKRLNATSHFR